MNLDPATGYHFPMRTPTRLAVAALLAAPLTLGAQSRVIDEGSFVISRNGVPSGREAFRIIRTASAAGDLYRASAQIAYGDRRVVPTLVTDSLGIPTSYEVTVRQANTPVLRLQARGAPGRLSVLEQTPHGESSREYVVSRDVHLIDDDVYHQYFFLSLPNVAGSTQVVLPQARLQGVATVAQRGSEAVDVGGKQVGATRWSVSVPGRPSCSFWVDPEGRLLRLAIPDRGIVVQREELPR